MPYKRKQGYKKKKNPKASNAVKKYVKKVLDAKVEDKFLDLVQNVAAATAATDTTGSVVLLSGMSQGTSYSTRLGESVNTKLLEVRYDTQHGGGGAGLLPTYFRVIVFRDMQIRSSTLPSVTDVLETAAYNSPLNHIAINASRFRILHDRLHQLDPILSGANSANSCQQVIRKIKLYGKIIYTNSSTGTQKGNVYVLYISSGTVAGTPTNSPPINMYSRLIFEDA